MPLSGSTQVSQSRGFSGLVADVDAARGEFSGSRIPDSDVFVRISGASGWWPGGVTSQARAIATSAVVKPPSSGWSGNHHSTVIALAALKHSLDHHRRHQPERLVLGEALLGQRHEHLERQLGHRAQVCGRFGAVLARTLRGHEDRLAGNFSGRLAHLLLLVSNRPMPDDSKSRTEPRSRGQPVTAGHLTREETAVYLRIKPSTLSLWHTQKKGPRSFLVGRRR